MKQLFLYGILCLPTIVFTWLLFLTFNERVNEMKYSHLPLYKEEHTFEKRGPGERYLVLIGVESYSLGDTTKMVRIANHLDWDHEGKVEVKFFHYGGVSTHNFENFLEETGQEVIKLHPEWESYKEIDHLYEVDRNEKEFMFNAEFLEERVKSELDLFKKLRPNIVVTGNAFSAKLSTQIANIPHIHVSSGLQIFDLEFRLKRILSTGILSSTNLNFYVNRILFYFLRKMNICGRWSGLSDLFLEMSVKFGVYPKIRHFHQLSQGDRVLVTDIPESLRLSNEQLKILYGENYEIVGPLYAELSRSIPEDLDKAIDTAKRQGRKIVYISMGSSGSEKVIMNIVFEMSNRMKKGDFSTVGLVIAPVKKVMRAIFYLDVGEKFHIPEWKIKQRMGNVPQEMLDRAKKEIEERSRIPLESMFRESFKRNMDPRIYFSDPELPAHVINELCDVAILHGGLGSVQSAASSGLPFIGVPGQEEQRLNVERLEFYGSAVSIPKKISDKSGVQVLDTLEYVLENLEEFTISAKEVKEMYQRHDTMKNIADIIFEEIRS